MKVFNSMIETKAARLHRAGLISMQVIFYLVSGCGLRSLGSFCVCVVGGGRVALSGALPEKVPGQIHVLFYCYFNVLNNK